MIERRRTQLYIDGRWVDPAGATAPVFNPATEESLGTGPVGGGRRR